MTVALYAQRKNWPLEAVTVRLRHFRVHAADCADCETKEGTIDRIERDLEFSVPPPPHAGLGSQYSVTRAVSKAESAPGLNRFFGVRLF